MSQQQQQKKTRNQENLDLALGFLKRTINQENLDLALGFLPSAISADSHVQCICKELNAVNSEDLFMKMVTTRGKVGLYSNAMARQAIKPKKAVGRRHCTRRWSKSLCLLANLYFFCFVLSVLCSLLGQGQKLLLLDFF